MKSVSKRLPLLRKIRERELPKILSDMGVPMKGGVTTTQIHRHLKMSDNVVIHAVIDRGMFLGIFLKK